MVSFKGPSFPFQISPVTGSVEVAVMNDSGDTTLLRQSIIQIIGTITKERVMEKYFGTSLMSLVFEQNDEVTWNILRTEIMKSLLLWEPRIAVSQININPDVDAGTITVGIVYTVKRTNKQDEFAFSI